MGRLAVGILPSEIRDYERLELKVYVATCNQTDLGQGHT